MDAETHRFYTVFVKFFSMDQVLEKERVGEAARLFHALGNRLRLRVILLLSSTDRPLHIKAVSKMLKVSYPTIYRHITILKKAGIIKIYEVGRSRVITLTRPEEIRKVIALINELKIEQ